MNTTTTGDTTMTSKTPTIDQLHDAILHMDVLADEGFAQIAAIAELATAYLYSSDLPVHDTIARAFGAIKRIAESQSESIARPPRHPLRAHRQIRAHNGAVKGP